MHIVEKLYGVLPTIFAELPDGGTCIVPATPSAELLSDLDSVGEGTIIAVDVVPDDERTLFVPEIQWRGRRKVLNITQYVSNDVEHLVMRSVVARAQERRARVAHVDSREFMAKRYTDAMSFLNAVQRKPAETMQWQQEVYRTSVGKEYFLQVDNALRILDQLTRIRPEILVVTRTQGDFIYSHPTLSEKFGITFAEYAAEFAPPVGAHLVCSDGKYNLKKQLPPNVINHNFVDEELVYDREVLVRRHRILQGRTLTDCIPDFVGTHDPMVPCRGQMEMYVEYADPTGMVGFMVDAYGIADFFAEVSGVGFRMESTYRPETLKSRYGRNIKYLGVLQRGAITGEWESEIDKGAFEIHEFNTVS
jgi:hypothetical protein